MKKYIYLSALLFICSLRSEASHIVGAQIYYDYLGNNQYRITLVEYRNCSVNCPQCAPFGDPQYVQIFDSAGNYIDSIALPLPPRDTIPSVYTPPCFIPFEYCVEVASYQGVITLPSIPGGYTLVYQRCCRNGAITNIQANIGATYFSTIPSPSLLPDSNSSPRFRQIVSQIYRIDTVFSIDMSATDPDHDSLVYRLTNAYDGASSACPDPSPAGAGSGCPTWASAPPYISVPYDTLYSAINPTNNPSDSGNLRIDPHTGLLSGTVNQSGIFLVAIAADEYRNGVLIGSTLIDFQFIFEACDSVVNSIKNIPAQSEIKIYSSGNEAIVDLSKLSNHQANISFYDLLGRELAEENNYSGNMYTRHFINIATQYIIVKVQMPDGNLVYKKLLIENGN